jgi:hypothetical protein
MKCFRVGKIWSLAIQLHEHRYVRPSLKTDKQPSLTYFHRRNLLCARGFEKIRNVNYCCRCCCCCWWPWWRWWWLWYSFKRLKCASNQSGIGIRSILRKQLNVVRILTLRGGNPSLLRASRFHCGNRARDFLWSRSWVDSRSDMDVVQRGKMHRIWRQVYTSQNSDQATVLRSKELCDLQCLNIAFLMIRLPPLLVTLIQFSPSNHFWYSEQYYHSLCLGFPLVRKVSYITWNI